MTRKVSKTRVLLSPRELCAAAPAWTRRTLTRWRTLGRSPTSRRWQTRATRRIRTPWALPPRCAPPRCPRHKTSLPRSCGAVVRDTPGHDRARFRPPMAGGGLLAAVRPSAPARRRAAHCVRLPRLSRGHSANVGGRGQCETPQHARALTPEGASPLGPSPCNLPRASRLRA